MENIQSDFLVAVDQWKAVYALLKTDSAYATQFTAQLGADVITIDSINEVFNTISIWMGRQRAPHGLAPVFQFAKSLAFVHVKTLNTSLKQIAAGQFSYVPTLVASTTNILSALHTISSMTNRPDDQEVTDLSGQLSQAIALLDSTSNQLAEKQKVIDDANNKIDMFQAAFQDIQKFEVLAESSQSRALDAAQKTEKHLEAIVESIQITDAEKKELSDLIKTNKELKASLVVAQKDLDSLLEKSAAQQAIIDSVLPKAASAGLAASFSDRVSQLDWAKYFWAGAFLLSVVFLSFLSHELITKVQSGQPDQFFQALLLRVVVASPLVWLGWFSAIQYGNTLRVQEDYAFKMATSRAYEGYRDHLEHLSKVSSDDGKSALNLLSERTIQILSQDPLRIYGENSKDVSPLSNFFGIGKGSKESSKTDLNGVDK